LTLEKIIKIVATRCQILRVKCTKFNFKLNLGEHCNYNYSTPPDPLARLRGLLQRGGEGTGGRRKREERGREGRGREGEKKPRGGEGTRPHPFTPP